ncbi:testis-expressed protein 2-like [Trichomycterus rosablanca]|uniref:testis-expressed protein 2-like n=1 Tax=Trichomycterus rosablanca TaxID=2290929 RepID=UPI002F35966F
MDDSKFLLSLDCDDKGPTVSFSKERPLSRANSRPALHSSAFHFPLSFSTPNSLGELSASSLGTPAVPSSPSGIVKSCSAFSKESALLTHNSTLNLVESHITKVSHREPEFSLSNSDSKLHLQPWKEVIQMAKVQDFDPLPKSAPSSPTDPCPNLMGSGSLFMAELEDTRRKLSEAMQEPFSRLSKMMGEDSGSPKTQKGDLSAFQGGSLGDMLIQSEDGVAGQWQEQGSPLYETPQQKIKKGPPPSFTSEVRQKLGTETSRYEVCTYGDVMQVLEIQEHPNKSQLREPDQKFVRVTPANSTLGSSDPSKWLICVGLLAYSFFVLPLSPYMTGLSVGLACGFMLGLAVVMMLAPKRPASAQKSISSLDDSLLMESIGTEPREKPQRVLQGWMNEMYTYDPETYHPSLCHSVYVMLEDCHLRLAYPRANIPHQATFNEPPYDTTFVHSRCFRLNNSKVSLLPTVLAKKRVWNKKYPICIMFAEEVECEEEEQASKVAETASESADEVQQVEKESSQTTTLYLFGRTGREKEEWYQHFLLALKSKIHNRLSRDESKIDVCSAGGSSQGSTDDLASMLGLRELAGSVREKILLDYSSYMAHFITSESCSLTPSPCHSEPGSPADIRRFSSEPVAGCRDSAWINALIGRIFWDFLREKYWADQVAHKVQKKLSKIRLPYFMNELTLTELDMGTCIPQVLSISKPSVDNRGLWLELEVVYTGSLHMTLETKMNLCKLGRENQSETYSVTEPSRIVGSRPRLSIIADSDEESSSAGSSDEDEPVLSEPRASPVEKNIQPGADGHGGGSTSRKILRFVDKIAKSKYFQKATENEYIKKKIAEVSNMPLLLTVEVLELSGSLAVNIPPPPTDRIWYSFRVPPRLDLQVKPMLGEREVTFTHVTEWIERTLQCEFQKFFVMPNMDDLYLPLMSSGMDNPTISQNSSGECHDRKECRDSQ